MTRCADADACRRDPACPQFRSDCAQVPYSSEETMRIVAEWLHRQAELAGVDQTYTASQALHEAARQIEKYGIEDLQ